MLALLFFAGALNYADRTAIASVFPLLRQDLAISDLGLAAIGSLFLWSYAISSLGAGFIADRVSRSRLVVASLTAWSIVTGATGLVSDSRQLYVLRGLLGLTECLYLPAAVGLLADYHGPRTRATALGIHSGGLTFGVIAGGTAAGYLGDHFGWRSPFLILGGAGILLAGLLSVLLCDLDSPSVPCSISKEPLRTTLAALASLPTYGIILTEAAFIASSNWIFANWLPLFFREAYGLTLTAAGFSGTFAFTAGATTGVLTGGYLSDRFAQANPRRRLLIQGIGYAMAAPLLLVFLGRPAIAVLGLAIFMHGFLRALGSVNELPLLCDLLPRHRRGAAFGMLNALNTFIGGSSVFASGILMSHASLADIFVSLVGVVFLASVVTLIGYRWVLPKDLRRQARDF